MDSLHPTTPVEEGRPSSPAALTQMVSMHPTTPVEERSTSSPAALIKLDTPYPKTPKGEKTPSSPATSTPGQIEDPGSMIMVEGASPTKFRPSELVDSDESVINDSTCTNLSNTPYIPPQEDTLLQEADSNGSWIAHRTRAHCKDDQEASVQLSLSFLIEDMRNEGLVSATKETAEGYVMITPQSIPMEWTEQPVDQQVWNTLARMENSIDKEEEEKKEKISDNIKTYEVLSEVVLKKARKVIVPLDVSHEYNSLGNLTFSIDKPSNDAQEGMSNALRLLSIVNMDKLPKRNLVNIIRLLIAICIDSYKKLETNNGIIAKLEISLRELYYNNEKLLAVDKCKKMLEIEVSEAKRQYEELSRETEAVEERISELNAYCSENLQTETINRMNMEKTDLIASCKLVETQRDDAIKRTEHYRHRVGQADAEIIRIKGILNQTEGTKLELEIELAEKKESYNDLDELHERALEKLTISDRSLKDNRRDNQKLRNEVSEMEDRIDNIQSEYQTERMNLNNQINGMKRKIEDIEIEAKTSRDHLREQERKSQKSFNKQEAIKKENLDTIQKYEEEIYNLKQDQESKDREIRKLNTSLSKRQETTQWSDQEGTGKTTPKAQRIPKKPQRTPPQNRETENTPVPKTADSTRVYESSSLTSDSDSSRGAIAKRKREDTKKTRKADGHHSDNTNKEFRIPKVTGREENYYRRNLINQKEFTSTNKLSKEESDKEDKIKKLENQLNSDARKHQKVMESLKKENEELKKASEIKNTVPIHSTGTNTIPTQSEHKGCNTVTPHNISTGTNTTPTRSISVGINTVPQVNCGRCIMSTSNIGVPILNPNTETPLTTGANPMTGVPLNTVTNPSNDNFLGTGTNTIIGTPPNTEANTIIGAHLNPGSIPSTGFNTMTGVNPSTEANIITDANLLTGNTPIIGNNTMIGILPTNGNTQTTGVHYTTGANSIIGTIPNTGVNTIIGAHPITAATHTTGTLHNIGAHSIIGATPIARPNSMIGATSLPDYQQQVSSSTQDDHLMNQLKEIGDCITNEKGQLVIGLNTRRWIKSILEKEAGTPSLQRSNFYQEQEHPYTNEFPEWLSQRGWHPPPTMLNLVYSHSGFWGMAPEKRKDNTGPFYRDYNIVRVEDYITPEGFTKRAFLYGTNANEMRVWFDFEEVKKALGAWIFPEISFFFNGRFWEDKYRKHHKAMVDKRRQEEEAAKQEGSQKTGRKDNYKGYNKGKSHGKSKTDSEWDDEEDNPRAVRSSGAGRASRPGRYEDEMRPGHDSRQRSRDRRHRSHSRDRYYRDRSQSRERSRGSGTSKSRHDYYGGRS